jgi:hypothetical protein
MPQKITSGLTSQATAKSFVFLQISIVDGACFIHVRLHLPLLFITLCLGLISFSPHLLCVILR